MRFFKVPYQIQMTQFTISDFFLNAVRAFLAAYDEIQSLAGPGVLYQHARLLS